jgi:hypothetical protein
VAIAAAYDSVGYAVVGPVLPALKARAGASSIAASMIFAGFSIGLVAGFAFAGGTTRRWGPRTTLLLGIAAHLAGDVLFVSGHGSAVYAMARVVQGLGSGGIWIGTMLSALTWWPERPGPKLGAVLAAYAVGAVAGPLLGALGGTVRPFLADGSLAVVAAAGVSRLPGGRGRTFGWHLQALRDRRLLFASSVVLLAASVYSSIEGSFTLRFSGRLSQTGLGALIATVALAAGAGSLLRVATRGPNEGRIVAQAGAVATGILLVGATAMDSPLAWFVLLSLAGLSLGAAEAGALGLIAAMPEAGMLTAQVAYSQAWALGFLIAPPGATWLTSVGAVAPGVALAGLGVFAALLGFAVDRSGSAVAEAR